MAIACCCLPCFTLSAAADAPAVRAAARPNQLRRTSRWTGATPSAGRGEMDTDDGDKVLPRGCSVVVVTTTPGAANFPVKGTSSSPIRSLDTKMCDACVAYQGSPGTIIETVVLNAFSKCTAVPHKRFEAALEAVESSLADKAILPIENSYTGSFHQSYDILLRHDLQIVQEVQMDVELCLLALPGVHKDDLKTIFSHPQYLAQCEHSISTLSVSKKNVDHGAAGAEIISKKKLRDSGVIGSARAAELYGLNILECNFQDESPNVTRYLVLAKTANLPKEHGQYKTSVVFCLQEGPGTLYKAIGAFWKRGINLTKIESRPNRGKPMRTRGTEMQFNYIFYADFEASMADVRAQNAMKDLQEIASFLRVLGCYPYSTTIT